jgi:hypothetical protein
VTQQRESFSSAVEDRDVTLGLTPGQLLLLVVAVYALVRFVRGLRG